MKNALHKSSARKKDDGRGDAVTEWVVERACNIEGSKELRWHMTASACYQLSVGLARPGTL